LVAPGSLETVVPMSGTQTKQMRLVNLIDQAVDFEIVELDPVQEDVSWLTVEPVSGTLQVGARQAVSVTFEASGPDVPGPGVYRAELRVVNSSPGGDVSVPVTMTVTLIGVEISPAVSTLTGDPGSTVTHTLQVTNTGTISESFSLAVSGEEWATSIPASVGRLAPGGSAAVQVGVEIPAQAQAGEGDTAMIRAVSDLAPDVYAEAQVATNASAVYGVQVSPRVGEASGDPGETVAYTLTVTNTGNASDSFDIGLVSGWPISAPLQVGPVEAGSSIPLGVAVRVPVNALAGESDTAAAMITSQGDDSNSTQAVLTTTANLVHAVEARAEQASQRADPGETLTYTLAVTNTGNSTDTITISITGDGWAVSAPESAGPFRAGEGGGVSILVSVPTSATAGKTHTHTVRLTSQGEASISATAELTSRVSMYAITLEPGETVIDAAPGETATWTLELTNMGDTAEVYSVAISSTWVAELTGTSIPLEPGERISLDVRVQVPRAARYNEEGVVILRATGGHGASASAVLHITVRRGLAYLPGVFKAQWQAAPDGRGGAEAAGRR